MRIALLALFLAAPAGAALTPNAERYLDEGLTNLYGLEYEKSRASFRKLIELEPDNPFGYLFESGAIWWQSSMEYGLFKDTPTLQGLFEQDVEAAIRKADPWTDSKDRTLKVDGHFVSGMALGTRGQWGLMRGHYVKAYFDGRKAMKHLKKCAKMDDEYYDVQLGLGVFDYQAARMQGVLRMAALVGVRGDEERGLEKMHEAMDKGRFASRQAAQFLSSIYILDRKDWKKALEVVLRLRGHFPESVYFRYLEVLVRDRLGDHEASLAAGREIFDRVKADPPGWNKKLLSIVCGLSGDKCLNRESSELAVAWCTRAIESTPEPKPGRKLKPAEQDTLKWLSLSRLYRAYMQEVLGHVDAAERDFKWVLAHPEFADGHSRARECMEHGCAKEDLLLYLRSLSRGETWARAGTGPNLSPSAQ